MLTTSLRPAAKSNEDEVATAAQCLCGNINGFPRGRFVGHTATFITPGDISLKPQTWAEITGNGYANRHDPNGDYVYGMKVVVVPQHPPFPHRQLL